MDSTLCIRPDPFRIKDTRKAFAHIELARTYGKPFNRKWITQLKGTTMAQHDPDPENPMVRGNTTQFIWEKLDHDEVQFSCEELPNYQSPQSATGITTTRFMHGIYNLTQEGFTHFDGAIHIYDQTSYSQRLGKNLGDHYMAYTKAKVFRFDSLLKFDMAEKLLSNFYRWNDLVPEYFSHH